MEEKDLPRTPDVSSGDASAAPAAAGKAAPRTAAPKPPAKSASLARTDPEYVADQQAQRDTVTRFDAERFRRIEDAGGA